MAITSKTLRLQAALHRQLVGKTDEQATRLLVAWAAAFDEVAPDLEATLLDLIGQGDAVSRATLLRSERLRRVLAHIADQLDALSESSQIRVTGDLRGIVETAGAAQAQIIASQLPNAKAARDLVDPGSWARIDTRQVDAIVRRTTTQITARHVPISDDAYAAVQRELVRGIAAGTNPRATARRMVNRVEGAFNGGYGRAENIARTETVDAYRAAAQLGQDQHADVMAGWIWSANLSARTCRSCVAMNGTEHPLSEPGPLDHQSGRCARIPKTKTWAQLGFPDIPEPPSVLPSSQDFFDGLTRSEQQAILGKSGLAAYERGEFPMSKWATRRQTSGWRDSYGPAPVPASKGGR